MDLDSLQKIAKQMVVPGKGILAADESNSSAAKRLAEIGVESTENSRRMYRELFLGTPEIGKYISGVILYDETIRQSDSKGNTFVSLLEKENILPGIKVDTGAVDFPGFPGEKVTEGLDGLRERLKEYYKLGARFAKWRAVIAIGDRIPTMECIHTNAISLGRYARLCQEEGIVPMIEPEVLLDGNHSMQKAEEVIMSTLSHVLYEVERFRADLRAVILKTSMVLPGSESGQKAEPKQIAEATVRALKNAVPPEIPGIVFLSGGQGPEEATANLDAIAELEPLPWEIAFSYARAIQGPALSVWQGKDENIPAAREVFLKRLDLNTKADSGSYDSTMEK